VTACLRHHLQRRRQRLWRGGGGVEHALAGGQRGRGVARQRLAAHALQALAHHRQHCNLLMWRQRGAPRRALAM
jgi:hypothetical protein